jgi:DNA-binding XRE family transcriptional regulator
VLTRKQLTKLRQSDAYPNRIKTAMRLANVTQVQLAPKVGVAQSQISEDATGKYNEMSLEKARAYARFFGCTVDDLFPAMAQEEEAQAS